MNTILTPSNVVKEWTEFGHHFQIELLAEPKKVGAGMRTHRLWDNHEPAIGGQWHYDLEGAVARAEYVLLCDYSTRISWLEQRVQTLERELHEQRTRPQVVWEIKA